jgi:hypothetical protein
MRAPDDLSHARMAMSRVRVSGRDRAIVAWSSARALLRGQPWGESVALFGAVLADRGRDPARWGLVAHEMLSMHG